MSKPYSYLAKHYDRLTEDIDYNSMLQFTILAYKKITGQNPGSILELACGTGSFAIEAGLAGYDVTGVDASLEMLKTAITKKAEHDVDISFIKQDIRFLDLQHTFDLAVCYLDGINHITDKTHVSQAFVSISKCLRPGGIFMFDLNSEYKFKKIFADNVYYESYDDLTYIWQNNFDGESGLVEFDLTFFEKEKDGKYLKYDETIFERYYNSKFIDSAAARASLQKKAIYDGFTFNEPIKNSKRIFYIYKKSEHLFK